MTRTDPALADAALTEPALTDPAPADAALAGPALTDPALADAALTEPALTERALTERALTERALTERALTERALTERALTERALTERALTGPALTGPALTDPARADHGPVEWAAASRRRPQAADVRRARAWLTRAVEPGRAAVVELVDRVGPVEAVHLLRSGAASAEVVSLAEARRAEDRAEDDLAAAAALGARLVTPEDDEWPDVPLHALRLAFARERELPEHLRPGRADSTVSLAPPLAMWATGPLPVAEAFARAVAVVGSRSATPYGEHVAAGLGHGLAGRRWTVVSGGAYGIDGAAHRGALAAGGATVAIVAGGLGSPYPRGHAALFDRIARDGLLVSEWPPDATPQRHRFLVRNRLIAGLAAGTVVVEAGVRSGALATARQALRAGRAVMAVPGPVTSAESAGVHQLLRDRPEVELVTRLAEVIELVGAIGDDLAPPLEAPRRPRDGLDPVSVQVLDGLPATGAVSPDRIAVAAGVPPLDVLRCLPGLEVRGLVASTPAGWTLTRIARGAGPR